MYKDKDKQREAQREWARNRRNKSVEPGPNVEPFVEPEKECVEPNVTPYQDDVVPEDMAYPADHPDTIQCGAITYQYKDAPKWLQRSSARSSGKWERMLVCVPEYSRPACLGMGGDRG